MKKAVVLKSVRHAMKKQFSSMEGSHDWDHIERVVRVARYLARREGADLFIVELGALLHDIADWKFHNGDTSVGPRMARELLEGLGVSNDAIQSVEEIVAHISYRGGTNTYKLKSIEGKVVQDADRLDAIGAIGIARVFAFGGSLGRSLHSSTIRGKTWKSFSAYQKRTQTSIAHFYEKLLLLKDKMNTKSAQKLARQRHRYLEQFLKTFLSEWNGSDLR